MSRIHQLIRALNEASPLTYQVPDVVPPEPGTEYIPENHIRLFHYTFADPEILIKQGLKVSSARGHTYGEPDVIWSSTKCPDPTIKRIVEFHVPVDDPRIMRFVGNSPEPGETAQQFMSRGEQHVTFGDDIKVEEFIAIHEPWHVKYRYIVNDPETLKEVLDGKHDALINDRWPEEKQAILRVKEVFKNAPLY